MNFCVCVPTRFDSCHRFELDFSSLFCYSILDQREAIMKTCSFCWRDNEDDSILCCDCKKPFAHRELSAKPLKQRPVGWQAESKSLRFDVTFRTAFLRDPFRFVRNGTVTIIEDEIIYYGKQRWSEVACVGIFVLITFVPLFLFGFGLGIIPAFLVVHYLCASDCTLTIDRSAIGNVTRKNRKITLKLQDPESGKINKSTFIVDDKSNATKIEKELRPPKSKRI